VNDGPPALIGYTRGIVNGSTTLNAFVANGDVTARPEHIVSRVDAGA
jgi:hypothetical protein